MGEVAALVADIRLGDLCVRWARAHPEPVPRAARRAVVRARLVTTNWPAALQVTALDADTGELNVFDACCGVPLVDAVAASGAVPGVWPLERFAVASGSTAGWCRPPTPTLPTAMTRL